MIDREDEVGIPNPQYNRDVQVSVSNTLYEGVNSTGPCNARGKWRWLFGTIPHATCS